jgi:hypothetical protein
MHHFSRSTLHAPRSTSPAPRPSESGVALVVTLLLLSIITFMTVTFLVVSRSQKGSVVTETDQAIARLAADTAFERAKAELLAAIMGASNEFNYGLLVSTNFINSAGYVAPSSYPFYNPLNVNYDYKVGGSPITSALDREQNIANLLYNPRPPVFITNRFFANSNEFRFYLDLNRNGRYDTNGFLPVIGTDGLPIQQNGQQNGLILSNLFVGDPEWIGSLERPEFQHSADNKFVNRYAYIAVPVGNTLDINCIHNYASSLTPTDMSKGDGFLRNQGVLTSEINLAAFLTDLNTNLWPFNEPNVYKFARYVYNADPSLHNAGAAFDDASALLRYRTAFNWANLANVRNLYGGIGALAFSSAFIDAYSGGPVMTGTTWPPSGINPNPTRVTGNLPWGSADSPNRFYTTQDLFDQSKTRPPWLSAGVVSFTDRLVMAGNTNSSYDRYTFYRLLSQLGTDSAPEPAGKLNLNYCNVDDNGNVVRGMATNFIPWRPEQFFTNAAIRLLANAGYTAGIGPANLLSIDNRGVTNFHIQIWPTNLYTPSVHRLLQLAANIYDASTVRTNNGVVITNLPSVFRPVFDYVKNRQVFITGYQEVKDASDFLNRPVLDLTLPNDRNRLGRNDEMVWGVPLVIGAKKGLPNFNKFALQTQVQVTRKLQFHRKDNLDTSPVNEMDQMFVVGITNTFGVQAWNSYASTFPRSLRMVVIPDMTVTLTNLETRKLLNPTSSRYALPVVAKNIPQGTWSPYNPGAASASFWVPLGSGPSVPYTNCVFLSNATYRATLDTFVPLTGLFERNVGTNAHVPRWQLGVRNRLRFALVDTSVNPNRIVDYVNLDSTEEPLDIADALMHENAESYACDPKSTSYTPSATPGSMWCTNRPGGVTDDSVPTFGIRNQIEASLGHTPVDWKNSKNEFPAGMSKDQAIIFFKNQFKPPPDFHTTNTFAAPYQPFRNVYKVTDWEANDPLVHYTISDLKNLQATNRFLLDTPDPKELPINSLLQVNQRYEPWGGNPSKSGTAGMNAPVYELKVKDPVANLQGRSDHWDFPTNKFPNIGWLGRVHRGTPWQTVYLKSPPIDLRTWQNWTGDGQRVPYIGQFPTNRLPLYFYPGTTNGVFTYDAFLTMPTNDWRILDLFTAALNDNATRGQLSINQTNLAAWSAVLSGVVALSDTAWTNAAGNTFYDANRNPMPAPLMIQPAGIYDGTASPATWPPLARIVNGINHTRANTNLAFPVFPNRSFQSLGDILAVPELTVASPFVNTNIQPKSVSYALTDAACERIPQQVLGLLSCDHTPRFVVYSFGQALKPADRSLVTSGAFSRLCTNYQVMAEAATRAVIRVDGAPTNSHIVVESFNVLPPD